MAIHIYLRVSTQSQHFAQQMQDIYAYFDAHGLDINSVDSIIEEKESGGKSYEDRKLRYLLTRCKPGDFIYAASTDRLGRNFTDMIRLMEDAKRRGITIVACKQGLSLDDNNMATKILLSIITIIDEDERERIRHRVKNGVTAAMDDIKRYGQRMTKRGEIQTHWGNEKGAFDTKRIMAIARDANNLSRANAKMEWREESKAVKFAIRKRAEGWGVMQITEELGKLYDDSPDIYSTPNDCKPTKGTVSKWIRESNLHIHVE